MLLLVAVATLLTGACASTSSSAPQVDTSRDLAEMKERILELQEQAAVTDVEMERLRAQLTALEALLAVEGRVALSESPASPGPTPPPIRSLPAASPTSQPAIEESDLAPEPMTDTGVGGVGMASDSASPASPDPGPVETAPAATMQPVDPAAQALYDRGYTLYHQGKYLDAEASFQRFLQAYPLTELSDNAQFWIGESRFARGDTRGALAAFREVLQKFPEGNKVPDALIKEGDCLEKLGDRDGARDRYNEVKRRFPDSGAAVMAEDRLASLDG